MQEQERAVSRVAVWLMGLDFDDGDPIDRALSVHRAIFNLTGDYDLVHEVLSYGKGVIAKPVTPEAAEVIMKWIEAAGGIAVIAAIDDGYYEGDDEEREAIRRFS